MRFTNQKLVIAGRVLELSTYEKPIGYGFTKNASSVGQRKASAAKDFGLSEMSSVWRSKANLRQLVDANAWRWKRPDGRPFMPVFITLTFDPKTAKVDVTNAKAAHKLFTRFVERLNDRWFGSHAVNGIEYVAVPERQKNKALHYHVLTFNLPKFATTYDDVAAAWGHGFTWVKAIKSKGAISRYLTKYMGKDMAGGHEFNGKRLFRSRGLFEPETIREQDVISKIIPALPPRSLDWQSKPISNGWLGSITFRRYILPEGFDIDALVDDTFRKKYLLERAANAKMPEPTGTPADNGDAQGLAFDNPI